MRYHEQKKSWSCDSHDSGSLITNYLRTCCINTFKLGCTNVRSKIQVARHSYGNKFSITKSLRTGFVIVKPQIAECFALAASGFQLTN